jgi:hypothetical protein
MSSPTTVTIKVADEVWIATALLHLEHPEREDFSVKEIEARVRREGIAPEHRKGVYVHAILHCVANLAPNPATHRMLYATGRSRRRLYRAGDDVHAGREHGKVTPERDAIPGRYQHLLDWYERGMVCDAPRADPLLALRGSGASVWKDEPSDIYVRRLREGW